MTYQITNAVAQTASNTYAATVTKPPPPVATNQCRRPDNADRSRDAEQHRPSAGGPTHGVGLTLTATVDQVSIAKAHHARTSTRAVAPTVRLRPIYFSSGSAVVSSADRAYLLSLRPLLADVRSISCTGFTDSRSTIGSNVGLAKRRAVHVCAILTSGLGINLTTVSRGELKPSHSNATASGRALNRRAQITLHY